MKNNLTYLLLFFVPLLLADTCKKSDVTPCFEIKKLAQRWKNAHIAVQAYGINNKVLESYNLHPEGIFTLMNNGSYKVISDDIPLDGKWQIDYPGCKLTLDNGTNKQRTFVIEKLSNDSLVISRKDTLGMVIYTQHYKRN